MAEVSYKPKVVGIGEVVYDILPDSRRLGGEPTEFLCYAVKNGGDAYIISAIGADDLGREVVSELNKFDISPVLEITPYPTGRVLVFNNPIGGNTLHILENAAWDYIPFSEASEYCIKNADIVYFDSLALRKAYSKSTISDLLDSANVDAIKFFDLSIKQNYYDKDTIALFLRKADVLKINANELRILRNLFHLRGTNDEICEKIKNVYNLKYIIFYDNLKEIRVFGTDEITEIKNARINNTFGESSDKVFMYTFITEIMNNANQQDASNKANQVAIEFYKNIKR